MDKDNLARIRSILSCVDYKEWGFVLSQDVGGRAYLQVSFVAPCSVSSEIKEQKGRKWWLSPYMTETEVVATAKKAVLAAEEHEILERFKYKGRLIYNPHFKVEDLIKLVDSTTLDSR